MIVAYHDLLVNGYGGSFTGQGFSNAHGNLIIEIFNKETKVDCGLF